MKYIRKQKRKKCLTTRKCILINRSLIILKQKNKDGTDKYLRRDVTMHKWEKDESLSELYFTDGFNGLMEKIKYDEEKEEILFLYNISHLTKEETFKYPPSAPVAELYDSNGIPYKNNDREVEILYNGFGFFMLENTYNFHPPFSSFLNFISEFEKGIAEMIWLYCLLFRHGMVNDGCWDYANYIIDEVELHFNVNGVFGAAICDMGPGIVYLFSVEADCADKCEMVAETIRDIIINEGQSVTYEEWKRINPT